MDKNWGNGTLPDESGWLPGVATDSATQTNSTSLFSRFEKSSATSRLLKNAHFVFARDGGNWLNFEEAVVEQA